MPARVAFAGAPRYALRSLEAPEARFFAPGERTGLEAFAPEVVVAFVSEEWDPGLVAGLDALTIGWIPDGVPRQSPGDDPPDQAGALARIAARDLRGLDRVVAGDPLVADRVGAWRSVALPVADSVFVERVDVDAEPLPLCIGPVGRDRDWILEVSRWRQGLVRGDGERDPEQLRALLARAAVGINVHAQPSELMEEWVPLHLAAGHLLVSERLGPAARGLVPGVDYVEVANLEEIEVAVWSIQEWPEAHVATRVQGRLKAELFRASAVYPRLISDALRDVAAFG